VELYLLGVKVNQMEENIRVVLADDHRMMREGIRALLERQGDIEVVGEAADGREAVDLAARLCPDVVVMDVSMPLLNGVEATRQIRRDSPGVHILILTVHEDKDYVDRLLLAGADGYIVKRAGGEELVAAIHAVCRGEAFLHPAVARVVVEDYVSRLQAGGEPGGHEVLTDREREVLQLIAEGYTSREISELLHISVKTVQNHRSKIMAKLDMHDRGELIKYAIQQGIIQL
jgi:two-component system, NarL family, response regulator NreC